MQEGPRVTRKIVVPFLYSAWLHGDLGRQVQDTLEKSVRSQMAARGIKEAVRTTRLPRAILVESDTLSAGLLMDAVEDAARELEGSLQAAFPGFHQQLGPAWTGTLQSVYPEVRHAV